MGVGTRLEAVPYLIIIKTGASAIALSTAKTFYSLILGAKSLQLYPTLCDPLGCSPPGSSIHGFLQARVLEWVAMPSSRGTSQPRDQTHISYISCIGRIFTTRAAWETLFNSSSSRLFLGWENPQEKGKASQSSILAWRIPWAG